MVTGTIVDEYKSPITIERLWRAAIIDAHNLMPKLLPQIISSIEILEGDGGVGTITKFNFTDAVEKYRYVKDRVEAMDHENHVFKYSIVEGGILGVKVNSYVAEVSFTSASDGGCLAKLKIEYESLGESLLTEEEAADIKSGILAMVKAVDGYLLGNFNAYA
ncbi:hypothetical protein ACOSP7_007239 [Xanthoceras sorbifolium]|uniref:Bet v I/Major latex protein domain-containing protein n=1 Tax=Xanthoceras sorbifolium TaxID=99658 RepID=A0ABQ8GZ74_9ROSI|nr:hypothetical protein JRO89_XSUnG0203500 [Xanthoceras sorbifolium]